MLQPLAGGIAFADGNTITTQDPVPYLVQPPPPKSGKNPVSVGPLHICAQYYPDAAIRQRLQGIVKLHFVVAVEGTVRDVVVKETSGSDILDQAAVTCAKGWNYKPATDSDGKPIAVDWAANVMWVLPDLPAPSN